MKGVAVQGFGERVHLGQELKLVTGGEQFSICLFDFVAAAGDNHQSEDVLAQEVAAKIVASWTSSCLLVRSSTPHLTALAEIPH